MVKTAIENGQNLIVEGCYIPFSWRSSFEERYLPHIQCRWLILSRAYILKNFDVIRDKANEIEQRLEDSGLNRDALIRENERNLEMCEAFGCKYILIDGEYRIDLYPFGQ